MRNDQGAVDSLIAFIFDISEGKKTENQLIRLQRAYSDAAETHVQAAQKIAERCRNVVFQEQIPQPNSKVSQVLTASMGVGIISLRRKDVATDFIALESQLLHPAKDRARNRFVTGGAG